MQTVHLIAKHSLGYCPSRSVFVACKCLGIDETQQYIPSTAAAAFHLYL